MKNSLFTKGTIWNTAGSLAYGINSFLMLAVVGRIGSIEQAGSFGIAFTTSQLLYIVGIFGINHFQQTDYREEYSFQDYRKAKAFTSIIMVIAWFLTTIILHFSGEKLLLSGLLTVLMLINSIGEMYQSSFFQKNRLDLSGKMLFIRIVVSLFAFVFVSVLTKNIIIALICQILVNLISTYSLSYYYIHKYKFEFNRKKASTYQNLIRQCFPLMVSIFIMNLLINIPKYGVEFLLDDTAQGYFSMIFIIAQVINLFSQFVFKPLLHQYSELLLNKQYRIFNARFKNQLLLITIGSITAALLVYLIGPQMLGFIYCKDLSHLRLAMVIVISGGGALAVSNLFYYVFVIMRKQKSIMLIYSLAIAVSFISTFLLVKFKGIIGASVAFGAGEFISIVLFSYKLKCELST